MPVPACVAHDALKSIDIEPTTAVNSFGTLHIHNAAADIPVIDMTSSCGRRSLLVQQRRPGSHSNTDDDDDDDGGGGGGGDDETIGACNANLASVQPGNWLLFLLHGRLIVKYM